MHSLECLKNKFEEIFAIKVTRKEIKLIISDHESLILCFSDKNQCYENTKTYLKQKLNIIHG